MRTEQFDLADEQATQAFGRDFAQHVSDKCWLIYLSGELGAGKTTVARALIGALVAQGATIQSPTYAYMHRYHSRHNIYHFDLYRLEEPQMLFELGLDGLLHDEQALRLVEWPERLDHLGYHPNLSIELKKINQARRAIVKYF